MSSKRIDQNDAGEIEALEREITEHQMFLRSSREKISELSSLVEISSIINSTLDIPELLNLIMDIAKKVMKAEASTLMLIDEDTGELVWETVLGEKGSQIKEQARLKLGEGIAGWVAEQGEPLLVPDVQKDPRFYGAVDEATGFKTSSILCVPLKAKGEVIGIVEAINKLGQPSFPPEDIELFSAYASQAAVAIANARMHERLLAEQRIEQELQIAHNIQQSFLPQDYPKVSKFKFGAKNLPARTVGGDLYDFIDLGGGRIGLVIADVSGKGIPAALYLAKVMSDFRFQALRTKRVKDTLAKVNDRLAEAESKMFVTLFYASLDPVAMRLTYASAGHNPPILFHGSKDKHELLEAEGMALGVMPGIDYEEREVKLQSGDVALLYTDGVPEAIDELGQEFGEERLLQVIMEKGFLSAPELIKQICREVTDFCGKEPQFDDLTMLAVEVE